MSALVRIAPALDNEPDGISERIAARAAPPKLFIVPTDKPKLPRVFAFERVVQATARAFDVSASLILSDLRHKWIVEARQAAMLVMCEETKITLARLGGRFRRDHSTVIHGRDAARERCRRNLDYAAKVERIRAEVRA